MIVIIDYGMGNLGSIQNMLKKIGATRVIISSNAEDIARAEKLILPGVGAFDSGMTRLKELDLLGILNEKVIQEQTPVLGICLGMQLLTRSSEEGQLPGLGWIDAHTRKFDFSSMEDKRLKIPHMGWNTVNVKKECALTRDFAGESRFYFVHSYFVSCTHQSDALLETNYGVNFVSAVHRDNIFGVQFHPEKSHKFGMRLLKNFVEYSPCIVHA